MGGPELFPLGNLSLQTEIETEKKRGGRIDCIFMTFLHCAFLNVLALENIWKEKVVKQGDPPQEPG